jgi:GNAT superfamily N-acetyltransferase
MPASQTRPLTGSDLDLVVRHRTEMFREMGSPEAELTAMSAGFRLWVEPRLRDGTYLGWVIEQGSRAAAGIGMMVLDWPPHPYHPSDSRRAYILNVFVEPEYRGKGLATALMEMARNEATERGIAFMVLHASPQGRSLYEKLGWKPTSEMSFSIPPD